MDENQKYVINRLNTLSREIMYVLESTKYTDEKWNEETENEINELIKEIKLAFPDKTRIQDFPNVSIRGSKFSGIRAQTQHLLSQVKKLADILDVQLESDIQKQQPKNVFNLIQNQNVTQNSTQVFENMISTINQLDVGIKVKSEIINCVEEFKQESTASNPNLKKLVDLWKQVKSHSQTAAAMLSYWATMTGIWDKIIDLIQ